MRVLALKESEAHVEMTPGRLVLFHGPDMKDVLHEVNNPLVIPIQGKVFLRRRKEKGFQGPLHIMNCSGVFARGVENLRGKQTTLYIYTLGTA